MIENNSMLHSKTSHNKNINYEQSSIASIGPTKKHTPSNTTLIKKRKVNVLNQNLNENNSIIDSEFNNQEDSSEEENAEETFINLFSKNHDDRDVNQCSSDIEEYVDSENEIHLNWGNPPDDDTIMARSNSNTNIQQSINDHTNESNNSSTTSMLIENAFVVLEQKVKNNW